MDYLHHVNALAVDMVHCHTAHAVPMDGWCTLQLCARPNDTPRQMIDGQPSCGSHYLLVPLAGTGLGQVLDDFVQNDLKTILFFVQLYF